MIAGFFVASSTNAIDSSQDVPMTPRRDLFTRLAVGIIFGYAIATFGFPLHFAVSSLVGLFYTAPALPPRGPATTPGRFLSRPATHHTRHRHNLVNRRRPIANPTRCFSATRLRSSALHHPPAVHPSQRLDLRRLDLFGAQSTAKLFPAAAPHGCAAVAPLET